MTRSVMGTHGANARRHRVLVRRGKRSSLSILRTLRRGLLRGCFVLLLMRLYGLDIRFEEIRFAATFLDWLRQSSLLSLSSWVLLIRFKALTAVHSQEYQILVLSCLFVSGIRFVSSCCSVLFFKNGFDLSNL